MSVDLAAVVIECQRIGNPFQYPVVKGPFDRRKLPLCRELVEPIVQQIERSAALHRANPDEPPLRCLSAPIVLLTGQTGSGKSRVFSTLTERWHGANKTRLIVPISPNDLLAETTGSVADPLVCRRVEEFLFEEDVPGFPGARPIDLFAQRIINETIRRLAHSATVPKLPADIDEALRSRIPTNWRDLASKQRQVGAFLKFVINHLGRQALSTMRSALLQGAFGTLNGEPLIVGPNINSRQRLMQVIGLSNYLKCPLTLVFDQFESLAIGMRDLSSQTMRAFMQKLLAELEHFESSGRVEFVPLCLLGFVGHGFENDLFDLNIQHRLPTLPNGKNHIAVEEYGFRIEHFAHARQVTLQFLTFFWETEFHSHAKSEAIRNRPMGDPLWPFDSDGLLRMYESRGRIRVIRDWINRCAEQWNALIGRWVPDTDFYAHRDRWLVTLKADAIEATPIMPENDIREVSSTKQPSDTLPAEIHHPPPPVDPVPPPSSPPASVADYLTGMLDSLEFRQRIDARLDAEDDVSDWIATFFLNLAKAQISKPPVNAGAWSFVRFGKRGVMVSISDAQNRNKHERLWREQMEMPYKKLDPRQQNAITHFLFLSVGSDNWGKVPAFCDGKPVIRYQITDSDWYRIFALDQLFDPNANVHEKPAGMSDEAIQRGVIDTLLRHWSLFLNLQADPSPEHEAPVP